MIDNFFKTWSEEMAYILGFICADGWLYLDVRKKQTGYGRVCISINKKDIDVLEKIVDVIGYSRDRIHYKKSDDTVYLYIYNSNTYNDLVRLGLTPNKSLTLKWINVPKEYKRHFIRGYFDGDGSLTEQFQTEKYCKLTIQFLGTVDFLQGLVKTFEDELGIVDTGKKIENTQSKAKCLRYRTKQARDILIWLYSDSNIYMNRKYNKLDNHINNNLNRKKAQRLQWKLRE